MLRILIVLAAPNAVNPSGTYYIQGSTAAGCTSPVMPVVVTINPAAVATIAYAGSPFCATGTVAVTQTGVGGGAYSSTAGLTIDPVAPEQLIWLRVRRVSILPYNFTNGTCAGTATTSVTINALPAATIAYPGTPYCAAGGALVTQTGQAGGTYSSTAGLSINSSTGTVDLDSVLQEPIR